MQSCKLNLFFLGSTAPMSSNLEPMEKMGYAQASTTFTPPSVEAVWAYGVGLPGPSVPSNIATTTPSLKDLIRQAHYAASISSTGSGVRNPKPSPAAVRSASPPPCRRRDPPRPAITRPDPPRPSSGTTSRGTTCSTSTATRAPRISSPPVNPSSLALSGPGVTAGGSTITPTARPPTAQTSYPSSSTSNRVQESLWWRGPSLVCSIELGNRCHRTPFPRA